MISPALRRLVVASVAIAAAVGTSPVQAASDWQLQSAPRWLDQTVYRPNCPAHDFDGGCAFARPCVSLCMRW
jgi:hypothetical protein